MANPAKLLYQQFEEWRSNGGQDREDSREIRQQGCAAWDKHLRAAQLLHDIQELLEYAEEQGHDVGSFREPFYDWVKMLWIYNSGWLTEGDSINDTAMRHLKNASVVFSFLLPELEESKKTGFDNFLTVLDQRVANLDDEHKHLRAHALRIIRHIHGCLDNLDVYGEFRILDALHDLQYILNILASEVTDKDDFFKKAASGVWSYFKKSAATLAISSAVVAGQSAIESASQDLYTIVKADLKAIATKEAQDAKASSHDVDDTQPLESHQ